MLTPIISRSCTEVVTPEHAEANNHQVLTKTVGAHSDNHRTSHRSTTLAGAGRGCLCVAACATTQQVNELGERV
eukprot:14581476-Alexandrium_andersonii.AAC.1